MEGAEFIDFFSAIDVVRPGLRAVKFMSEPFNYFTLFRVSFIYHSPLQGLFVKAKLSEACGVSYYLLSLMHCYENDQINS